MQTADQTAMQTANQTADQTAMQTAIQKASVRWILESKRIISDDLKYLMAKDFTNFIIYEMLFNKIIS